MKELNLLKSTLNYRVLSCIDFKVENDKFARELIDLWNFRKMKGHVHSVVTKEKEIVAFLLVELRQGEAINRGLFVKNSFRNKGLANALLTRFHIVYNSRFIWTNINEEALGFYIKYHYIIVGKREEYDQWIAYYPNGIETENKITKLKQKIKNMEEMVSLFEYLGFPAGRETGNTVYKAAKKKGIEVQSRQVNTKTYKGQVMLYPKLFLDGFFSGQEETEKSKKNYE